MNLNTAVLKRTHGLLSEIDEVLRKPSIAERVDRVLSSAAPRINDLIFPTVEDWEIRHFSHGTYAHISNACDCERTAIHQVVHSADGARERTYNVQECHLDEYGRWAKQPRIDPFYEGGIYIIPPYERRIVGAADVTCGVKGCGCEEVFDDPLSVCRHCNRTIRWDSYGDQMVGLMDSWDVSCDGDGKQLHELEVGDD
jgi:hypothetical protein